MSQEAKALVFDVDGTILNTFEHIVQAFEIVLPTHGVEPDREAIRLVIGKTLIDCYKALVPSGDHQLMADTHHNLQQTPEMYELITAYDGLREAVEACREMGIKAAVLTNRGRNSIDPIFEHIGLTNLFDVVVTSHENPVPKPDPAGILMIADLLGIMPEHMVMVGDTPIDVTTAHKAGMAGCIAVTHGFGKQEELVEAGATTLISSFEELIPALNTI